MSSRANEGQHPVQKFYFVYLLRSVAEPNRVYVGITEDLDQRLAEHNAGKATHTSKYLPWQIETYLAFSDKEKAVAFERYLKTSSGIAFARKRLRNS